MKKPMVKMNCFFLLLLLISYSWAADEAEYDSTSGVLTIPKVKIGSQYIYDASLQLNNQGLFAIISYSATQAAATTNSDFSLSSDAIVNGELQAAYKCEQKDAGIEKSIPLSWSNVPDGTKALAIIMHHFPNPNDTTKANSYLLLWDIAPSVNEIAHGQADDGPWYMGANKDGDLISYTSPCSPSSGTHEYSISLYALSETPASLPQASSLDVNYTVLKAAIESVSIIATATLTFNDVTP